MIFGHETPSAKDTRSVFSLNLENRKKLLSRRDEVNEFELKISLLWELYELLIQIMQEADKGRSLEEATIKRYIKEVSSEKYEWLHELCELLVEKRSQRTVRMSRLLENLSIFETCLNSIQRKRENSAEIINFLGYSSSSVIFIIKLLFTTHETAFTLSERTLKILTSINEFEHESYREELRSPKDILRRMEHNNEIISMLKMRCGKKHGKYCEEFITQMVKTVEQNPYAPFFEISNNIFEFMSFHLHQEGLAARLPLLALPPAPFLSLKHAKTLVIEPWGVLVYRKNEKLVIRAHTGKFLAEISDGYNVIFWTELMPKDADVLMSLLPAKENIYWLYRYHCSTLMEPVEPKLKNSPYVIIVVTQKRRSRMKTEHHPSVVTTMRLIKNIEKIGSISENTIIVDYDEANILQEHRDHAILMPWRGEKKDVRLLRLSEHLKAIMRES